MHREAACIHIDIPPGLGTRAGSNIVTVGQGSGG
jgi:hypothetical protein